MFGSFPPSPLVGLRLQSLLGPGSRHCYGIITLIDHESVDSQLVQSPDYINYDLAHESQFEIEKSPGGQFGLDFVLCHWRPLADPAIGYPSVSAFCCIPDLSRSRVTSSSGEVEPRSFPAMRHRLHRHRGSKTRCPVRSRGASRTRSGRLAAWPENRFWGPPAGDQNA